MNKHEALMVVMGLIAALSLLGTLLVMHVMKDVK